jgi:myo-inositol-1-phosphate synthase
VHVDNHEWVVVFLPHCIDSPNFAGLVCELLRYLPLTFDNDECPRVYTCVWLMPKPSSCRVQVVNIRIVHMFPL